MSRMKETEFREIKTLSESVETLAEVKSTDDLLNRQPFVDQVIAIIELMAKSKKTACFAINGKWGVGKSFVLKMLEGKLEKIQSEETADNKYMIFHYNCWQYDYYEEPLVAIVASMLDTIDEKENLISGDTKSTIKGFLKAVGSALLIKTNEAIEKKTGYNPQEIVEVIKEAKDNSAKNIEEEHRYDGNFIFKATLKKLQETIGDLSKDKTIIFTVDELDRCLPEYAIKILERLHHVFADIPNVQVVLSIDKSQLEHIIKKTFGQNTETKKYLSKFINFEVNLDEGAFGDANEFNNKFNYYIQNFDYLNDATKPHDVNLFVKKIFTGIDMRSRIEIVEKCNLLHKILQKGENKKDFSFMCVEIAFSVLLYWGIDIYGAKNIFNSTDMFNANEINTFNGLAFLNLKLAESKTDGELYYNTEAGQSYVRRSDIWGAVLSCYRYSLGYTRDVLLYDSYKNSDLRNYCIEFRNLLNVIV